MDTFIFDWQHWLGVWIVCGLFNAWCYGWRVTNPIFRAKEVAWAFVLGAAGTATILADWLFRFKQVLFGKSY